MKDIYTKAKNIIEEADAIIIGAGIGLSFSANLKYGTKNFAKTFPGFVKRYNFTDLYSSSFYNFNSEEEKWSYWIKHIKYIYTDVPAMPLYKKLYKMFNTKNYFIITTTVDRQFLKAGFPEEKVFEIDGCLSKNQCTKFCQKKVFDNTNIIRKLLNEDREVKIPSKMVPKCPNCGAPTAVNIRQNNVFIEDDNWFDHNEAYKNFIAANKDKKIVFLELGTDLNKHKKIRDMFEEEVSKLNKATLIRINEYYHDIPNNIKDKTIVIKENLKTALKELS